MVHAHRAPQIRFYPWVMALLVMFMLMVTNGFTTTSITGYDESLLKEFGWSRGQLKFRDLITLFVAGIAAPFAGVLIDRVGVRKLMLAGSLPVAAGYFSYGYITSLTQMYLIHVVFGVALVCAGINIAVIHVSQWFMRQRGTAIGIALVGSSLGGVVFTPMIVSLVAKLGWRETFEWMSLFNIALFVACYFLARRPDDLGQRALGYGESASGGSSPASSGDVTHSGKFLGTITLMDAVAGGLGIWLTGVLFNHFKNYDLAFYVLVGLVGLALIASRRVKREIKLR